MIYKIATGKHELDKLPSYRLSDIGWTESDLQRLLFDNIEKVFEENDLLLIMQSRNWQEEPDLMAVDKSGELYIFELKAWESMQSNLLQVLRYGQIYGQYNYQQLNSLYRKHFPKNDPLIDSLNDKFGISLQESDINKKQHFIIITNGLDYRTREAILYWLSQGLDTKSWIYRLYKTNDEILFELNTFELNENPFSDIEEGYFILNTNIANSEDDDEDMLHNSKAAAYFDPWKRKIEKVRKGHTVFLYRSRVGIVAYGFGTGKIEKAPYQGDPKFEDEECYTRLNGFVVLKEPLAAKTIKELTGVDYRFMSTMFSIDSGSGKKLLSYLKEKKAT